MSTDSEQMKSEWNERAKEDALYFIETSYGTSDIEYFFQVGEEKAQKTIDPVLNSWDNYPLESGTALDIGCGVGRMTRTLADRFDHVIGIDVAEQMIERAESLNEDYSNIDFYSNDGIHYSDVEESSIDFVFSYEVFQHFPDKDVIESNINEVSRVMKPEARTNIHFKPYNYAGENVRLFGYIPFPSELVKYVPSNAVNMYSYLTNNETNDEYADQKSSETWTGSSVSPSEFWEYCENAGLVPRQFMTDPTHSTGERFFCVADKED